MPKRTPSPHQKEGELFGLTMKMFNNGKRKLGAIFYCRRALIVSACVVYLIIYLLLVGPEMKLSRRTTTCDPKDDVKIYVYPAPAALEVDRKAETIYFQLETELLAGLRSRGRIVEDPAQANIFWVPHALIGHWVGNGYNFTTMKYYYEEHFRPFLQHIYHDLPYFNASRGANHVLVYAMDNGPICEHTHRSQVFVEDTVWKDVVHPMTLIGYWGHLNSTAPDQHQSRYRKACWDEERDIAVPQWHDWNMEPNNGTILEFLQDRADTTTSAFYFKGSTRHGGQACSEGIREWVGSFCQEHCQAKRMEEAVFGLCPAGWACWSSRQYDVFRQGVIPVMLADNMVFPFQQWLDYSEIQKQIVTGNPVNMTADGGVPFRSLQEQAGTWMETCRDRSRENDCLNHPVSRMMTKIAEKRHWFGWQDDNPSKNAFAMVERELASRFSNNACTAEKKR